MNVTKSAVYKLAVESSCGCKACGEFNDSLYKERVGESVFFACAKHADFKEVVEGMMLEMLEKEVKDVQDAPPPAPAPQASEGLHPRTVARLQAAEAAAREAGGTGDPQGPVEVQTSEPGVTLIKGARPPATPQTSANASAGPARTVRTSGTSGTSGGRPAGSSNHRPAGGGSGPSPFRRTGASSGGTNGLSPQALAAIAGRHTLAPIEMDIGGGVAEDRRITQFVERIGLCNDPNDPDDCGDDDMLGED